MKDINYQKLTENFVHKPTAEQEELISVLSEFLFKGSGNQIFLLRGYAGTGKTSMISAVVRTLKHQRIPVILMAPTGRAAKVLSSYSSHRASTIHRRIYFALTDSNGNLVLRLQKNTYKNAVFLVDEASMIGDERSEKQSGGRILLNDLLEFIFAGENSKLILVGDVAQLPPVGLNVSPALNTVHLKNAFHYPVFKFELSEVVRQEKASGILANATRLRQVMVSKNYTPPFLSVNGFKDIVQISSYELADEVMSAYDFVGQDDTAIITRSNKVAYQYNQAIRTKILGRDGELEAGDILMVVKNNYFWLEETSPAGFLANGDLVEVEAISKIVEDFGFRFADVDVRLIDYPEHPSVSVKLILNSLATDGPALSSEENNKLYYAVLNNYSDISDAAIRKEKVRNDPFFNALQVKYAYAMTCHKTQGGQWNTVFIDLGYLKPDGWDLDFLRWLYTAITRATKRVFLINFPEELFD
jgi:ATP-dependent exoDNAse (exonuclease V) alpha subunit